MTDNFRTATVGIYDLTLTLVGTSYHMQGGPHGSHIISAAHTSSERLDAHWAGYIDTAYKAQSTPHPITVARIVREEVSKECPTHCPPDDMDILFAVTETMETLFANAGAPLHSFLDTHGHPLPQVDALRRTSVELASSMLRGAA
tara:strand:+ start:2603 stop:3037 length:435 start_codon:yes stop_codon:yes gene_type:complete